MARDIVIALTGLASIATGVSGFALLTGAGHKDLDALAGAIALVASALFLGVAFYAERREPKA